MKIVIVSDWRFSITRVFPLLILCLFSLKSFANSKAMVDEQKLHIAVASNFYLTAKTLAEDFEQSHGVKVQLTSGSSGLLANQIAQGAPFDVFLSADEDKVKRLSLMLSLPEENISIYALGQLMLVYDRAKEETSCEQDVLIRDLVRADEKKLPLRVLIANPVLAPYGAAAEHYMNSLGIENDGSRIQFVYGNNIAQLAQMFTQGAAKYVWLAASQKVNLESENNNFCFFIVPIDAYPEIKQAMLVLHPEKKSAKQFQEYLLSEHARQVIKQNSYALP